MTDPGAEASRAAIAAERLRSIRFVGLFRFVGISTAGAVGAALEVRLSTLAGETPQVVAWSVPVLVGVAAVCIYTTRRTIRLVESVAAEQRRRERLGRYFSPHVAARVEALGDGAAAGESREVTLLFSDLREFTALSETLASE